MANTIDIFNSKLDENKLVGDNRFFNNNEELTQFNKLQQKYISNVDYSSPNNFARFGSAEEYYKNAINYINSEYPYDASTAYKLNWINSLNEFEFYLLKEEYPKSTGYSKLSSSQYIEVFSHVREPEATSKNAYDAGSRYTANTILDFDDGFTFESWLNFQDDSQTTDILKINAITSSLGSLATVNLLKIYRTTGPTSNFSITDYTNTYNFNTVIPDNEWHHYAFHIKSGSASLFIDGTIKETIDNLIITPSLTTYIFVPLGLMIVPVASTEPFVGSFQRSSVFEIGGGGLVYVDEARMWNGKRSIEKIGRYWFTQVDGNDFDDENNSKLLFYYKFNEGWDSEYKILCLDYSGRGNDGEIKSYSLDCRATGSAIDECGFVQDAEKQDPIYKGLLYSQVVKDFYNSKLETGKEYDYFNNHSLYNKFPSWILQQEEEKNVKHLRQIIQIVSSYFDDLYNKIKESSDYKTIKHNVDKNNLYPFYDKILTSTGFDVTDLFSNLDAIEKISSRNDTTLFDEDIEKIKNAIFQNIYNNLSYILKSKGTEKSIRSFFRTYGISDELIRVNLYADNTIYDSSDRSKEAVVKKKTVTLTGDRCIYLSGSSIEENLDLKYYTLETSVAFPKKSLPLTPTTSSIFGLQNNSDALLQDWSTNNYKIYAYLETDVVSGSRFVLSDGGSNTVFSEYYTDLYDDSVWNLAIRKKPIIDTLEGAPSSLNYTIELYGINKNAHYEKQFMCSIPFTHVDGYIKYYIGARNTDLNGITVLSANSKFLYCNFWTNYLSDEVIESHNKDILNYGVNG